MVWISACDGKPFHLFVSDKKPSRVCVDRCLGRFAANGFTMKTCGAASRYVDMRSAPQSGRTYDRCIQYRESFSGFSSVRPTNSESSHRLLGPFYGAIAVPLSLTHCRCCRCCCCGHRFYIAIHQVSLLSHAACAIAIAGFGSSCLGSGVDSSDTW